MTPTPRDVRFFETADELRAWFEANHATAEELWLGYHRKGTGRPSVDWPLAVDEALCVGWIDSIRVGLDEATFAQRFTPRRKASVWSAVNVANVERLQAAGRMRPAGLAAFEARTPERTGVYSYERVVLGFSAAEAARFRADAGAWADWERRPPSYRKAVTHWVTSPKGEETRQRRFEELLVEFGRGAASQAHAGRAQRCGLRSPSRSGAPSRDSRPSDSATRSTRERRESSSMPGCIGCACRPRRAASVPR